MHLELRKQIFTEFPEWHRRPFRLSVEEMKDPGLVITEFFEGYSLPDIRACLRQWLIDAIFLGEAKPAVHFSTYEYVEKLIEAVWVLHNRKAVKLPTKKKRKH
jgi:hypothetical protein